MRVLITYFSDPLTFLLTLPRKQIVTLLTLSETLTQNRALRWVLVCFVCLGIEARCLYCKFYT